MDLYQTTPIFLLTIFMLEKIKLIITSLVWYKNIQVVKGIKNSNVVIIKKSDYVNELETVINDGVIKENYVETTDNTLKELLQFQDSLYRNFHNCEHYKDMKRNSNEPAYL